jgi:hypothetical protein
MDRKKMVSEGMAVEVDGLRLSGEAWTSLANGFSNLMLWKFFCKRNGVECVGVVEGDDGLFGFTSRDTIPTSEQFAKCGFSCKIQIADDLNTASFCGIIFDPVHNINTTDPRPFLASLSWLPYKYKQFGDSKKRALMRAKAMSFFYQYPGCPVIQSAALAIMRLTRSTNIDWVFEKSGFFNAYEEEELWEMRGMKVYQPKTIHSTTRVLFFENFGIPPSEQIEIEEWFESLDSCSFSYPEFITRLFPSNWLSYAQEYKVEPTFQWKSIQDNFSGWGVKAKSSLYGDVT